MRRRYRKDLGIKKGKREVGEFYMVSWSLYLDGMEI